MIIDSNFLAVVEVVMLMLMVLLLSSLLITTESLISDMVAGSKSENVTRPAGIFSRFGPSLIFL